MGKVNLLVKYCLINKKKEYNIKGILLDNKLKFFYDTSCIIIDFKSLELEKNDQENVVKFSFLEKKCQFISKSDNKKISFPITVEQLKVANKSFYVKYKIENDAFEIEIKIL